MTTALFNPPRPKHWIYIAIIISALFVISILNSCKSKEERARRLIDKANRLYPIELMKDTILKVDTILTIDTFVVVKKDTVYFNTIIETEKGKIKPFTNKLILNDSKAKVFGSLDSLGKLNISVEVKEKKQQEQFKIKFQKTYITKRIYIKSPPQIVKLRGLFWWTGLMFWISLFLFGVYKGLKYFKYI